MTTEAAKKIRAKRARRPVYAVVERLVVLETGEERLAILAAHPIDRKLMHERGYRRGDELRLEIKKPRNVKFHRLAHAVGALLVDNVEAFRHLGSHDALKQVQREAGVCCEAMELDLGPVLGKVPVQVPRSIAFDEMDGAEFEQLFLGICDFIDQHYQSAMTDEVRAEYLLMVAGQGTQPAPARRAA